MTVSKLDLSRITPKGYSEAMRIPELGVLVFRGEDPRLVKAFSGRSKKPDFFLRFESAEAADCYLAKWVKWLRKCQEERRAKREACKVLVNPLAVGVVLVASYGWEQTNVHFYQVVATPGKATVEVREVESVKITADAGMMGTCLPALGAFRGDVIRKRVNGLGEVKIDSCRTATPLEFTIEDGVTIYKKSYWSSYA